MNNITENLFELITAYLDGECGEEEKIKVLEWINASEENKEYFFELKAARNLSVFQKYPDKNNVWSSIENKLKSKERFNYHVFLRIAAVFVVAIGLGISASILTNKLSFKEAGIALNETVVPYGGKAQLTLPDGTTVHLNSGSKFSYPAVFSKTERTVYLEGEAFFKVKTNKEKPFVVNTKEATIKAYGTEFNVNAYEDEPVVTATLVEGIITVTPKNNFEQEVVLKPKEHAVIQKARGKVSITTNDQPERAKEDEAKEEIAIVDDKETETTKEKLSVQSKIDTDIYTSWKDDSWIIENESLQSLSKKLERRYDVKISFSDEELKKFRFTGRIEKEPLEQVLLYISLTASLNHKIEGREVKLYLDTSKIDYKTLYKN